MEANMTMRYLSDEQIFCLNEKYGWFQDGDAQSDVSRSFANDAIAMHERIRAAATDLLEAANEVNNWLVCWPIATAEDMAQSFQHMQQVLEAAIAKATGAA